MKTHKSISFMCFHIMKGNDIDDEIRWSRMSEKANDNTVLFQPNINLNVSDNSQNVLLESDMSIYIHIPFCEKKCYFCSIVTSQQYTEELLESYVNALVKEIESYKELLKSKNIKCIHFGGGTPSVLNSWQIRKILKVLKDYVPNLKETEIVFESSPATIQIKQVKTLAEYGKLSLNLGVQTFDQKILKGINRDTNIEKLREFLSEAQKYNLHTLGIDLICNLPLSDTKTTINDVNVALDMGVNYFSLYPLRMEAKTVLYNNYDSTLGKMPAVEKQVESFENAVKLLLSKGFERYSIYHFNATGRVNHLYSRLQIKGGEWIGLGAGANSYFQNQIFANVNNVREYIEKLEAGTSCIEAKRRLNETEKIVREIVYSLRSGKVSKDYYIERYGSQIYHSFDSIFEALKGEGYIEENEKEIMLNTEGNFNLSVLEKMVFDKLKIN